MDLKDKSFIAKVNKSIPYLFEIKGEFEKCVLLSDAQAEIKELKEKYERKINSLVEKLDAV